MYSGVHDTTALHEFRRYAKEDKMNSVGFHHAGIGSGPGLVNLFESAFEP